MKKKNDESFIEHYIMNLTLLDRIIIPFAGSGCIIATVSFIWLILELLGG